MLEAIPPTKLQGATPLRSVHCHKNLKRQKGIQRCLLMNYTKIFKIERSTFLAVSKQSDEHGFNLTYNCFEAGNGVVQKTDYNI
jgi:hypothetical protein